MWNERDPILKERLFGLTNSEGNHGEDVKEYYFYLDSTPTHSYMKYLYKYPQREFPYRDLVETNRSRSREEFEYELLDTGIFDGDRYFDVFVEYAKAAPEDVLVRITVHNRGPELARLRVLPTLWFRNTWSWGEDTRKPSLWQAAPGVIQTAHPDLGEYWLHCDGAPELLFTENESNAQRLWGQPNASPCVKDAFHALVVSQQAEAVLARHGGHLHAAVGGRVHPIRNLRFDVLDLTALHVPEKDAGGRRADVQRQQRVAVLDRRPAGAARRAEAAGRSGARGQRSRARHAWRADRPRPRHLGRRRRRCA